ncbi:MATE family efflux transporter [Sphingomonas ginsenosidivorax]|nr:MATE family efflux transporter [Sphingomonas ginsenosidivorax]
MAGGGARSALATVGLTAAVGWSARIVAAAAQLIAVRLLIQTLSAPGYGIFAVIIGLLNWFALADLGFGAGLQNFISAQRVAGNSALHAIRSTCILLLLLLVMFVLLWTGVSHWVGPLLLHDLRQVTASQAATIFLGFAIVATGAGLASVGLKICFAEHRGYIAHMLTLASTLTGVAAIQLLRFIPMDQRITWALVLYQGPLWLLPAGYLVHHVWKTRRDQPWLKFAEIRATLHAIWLSARVFLLFGILGALVLNIDYVLLAQAVKAEDIAVYAVFARIFALIFFVFSAVTQAYWPVMAELFAKGDHVSLNSSIFKCLGFGLVVIVGGSILFYFGIDIVKLILFTKNDIILPRHYIILFAVYWMIRVWTDTFATVIQSGGKTAILCAAVAVQAVVNFIFSYIGAIKYGITGLMVGTSIAFVVTVAWMLPLYVWRYMINSRQMEISL